MSHNINLCLLRFLIPMSSLSPFDTFYFVMLKFSSTYSFTTLKICITWLELHFGKQNVSIIVDHSMFSDYTCSIGHSKIYSNYLFIYFVVKKKKKEKRRSPQIGFANCNALTLTTSYLPCSSLFIVTHFFPYINIHIPKV